MYAVVLFSHSWLRWAVLGAGLLLLTISLRSWARAGAWDERYDRLRVAFLRLLDVQFLLGLALYLVLSPLPRVALADPGAAMADGVLRFYGLEHALGMLVAVVVAHGGLDGVVQRPLTERARRIALTSLAWALITLASVPWPFLPYGRPLFRT